MPTMLDIADLFTMSAECRHFLCVILLVGCFVVYCLLFVSVRCVPQYIYCSSVVYHHSCKQWPRYMYMYIVIKDVVLFIMVH